MEVITYKKKTKLVKKLIIQDALEYRPLLNISRNFFQKTKIKATVSIEENTVIEEIMIIQFVKLLTYTKANSNEENLNHNWVSFLQ